MSRIVLDAGTVFAPNYCSMLWCTCDAMYGVVLCEWTECNGVLVEHCTYTEICCVIWYFARLAPGKMEVWSSMSRFWWCMCCAGYVSPRLWQAKCDGAPVVQGVHEHCTSGPNTIIDSMTAPTLKIATLPLLEMFWRVWSSFESPIKNYNVAMMPNILSL